MTFDLDATERGNILLVHNEEFYLNSWTRLGDGPNRWLQVSYRADNYPAFTVNTITTSDEELAAHIRKEFGGGLWTARKLNIEGVKVAPDQCILGNDDEFLSA